MLKLYKLTGDEKLYWETWEEDTAHVVHWGRLGDKGESKEIPYKQEAQLNAEISQRYDEGYAELGDEDHYCLEVVFDIDGFGTPEDLQKRHDLESRLNNAIGWAGLGHLDGGSIGSDTMEVFVYVADPEIGKRVIEDNLRGTKFGDYSKITVHAPESHREAD